MMRKAAIRLTVVVLTLSAAMGCDRGGYAANISSFERTEDPRKFVVAVGAGACDELDRYEVQEDAARVQVSVWVNAASSCQGSLDATKLIMVEVQMTSELGARAILDSSGVQVPLRAA